MFRAFNTEYQLYTIQSVITSKDSNVAGKVSYIMVAVYTVGFLISLGMQHLEVAIIVYMLAIAQLLSFHSNYVVDEYGDIVDLLEYEELHDEL